MLAFVSMGSDVVDRLVAALQGYDAAAIRALSVPGLRHWISITEEEHGLDRLLATLERERSVVADVTMDVRRRVDTADGVVLMLTVDGTTNGGATFHIPVCLVVTFVGGLITRIDEYANIDHAKGLLAEMT
jgi:ketosteroid isomerase-like protein